jgi:hypothetical protein
MLGRQPVFGRDHRAACLRAQVRRPRPGRTRRPQAIPAAVKVDHRQARTRATEKAQAAARHAAGRAAARELVAEYESEHGPLPAASRQRAREFMVETGLIDDGPQRVAG